MKHYTYKVTFPGMPWYYWGVHTDSGKPYFGSPSTHKWVWDFYECEIQILEWFENRPEAEKAEDRLIKHFIKDPNCLNEHWGMHFPETSSEERSKRSKKAWESTSEKDREEKLRRSLKAQPRHLRSEHGKKGGESSVEKVAKGVEVTFPSGNTKVFRSMTKAAEATGTTRTTVRNCCVGKYTPVSGLLYKFVGVKIEQELY
jgi:hypothetical protein